jgi:two-component system alkaline phosphatase synthesis response regulator PhoP
MDKNKKILVVDDDAMIRASLRNMLKKEGYEVIEAAEGGEGLRLALEESPAVIFSDRMMPEGVSGLDMLRRLREMSRDIPFVFLTALTDPRDKFAVADLNVTTYLGKPLLPETLRACLKSILGDDDEKPPEAQP